MLQCPGVAGARGQEGKAAISPDVDAWPALDGARRRLGADVDAIRRVVVEVQPAPRRARYQRPGALPERLECRYARVAARVKDDNVAGGEREPAVGVALEHPVKLGRVRRGVEKAVRSLEGLFAFGYEEDLPAATDVLKRLFAERVHVGGFHC